MPEIKSVVSFACRILAAFMVVAAPAASGTAVAAEAGADLAYRLDAIVRVHAEIPPDARTAPFLGTTREGSGVVIDDAGLVVTIGYLITEAMAAQVTTAAGAASRAEIIGFDSESGLGLIRAAEPLNVRPMPIGTASGLAEKTPMMIAAFGGRAFAQPAFVVSRRPFAGSWEYLLEDAIFTAPPYPEWSGAALIGPDFKLAGIGSLMVGDAGKAAPGQGAEREGALPGNMFVPIDRLLPAMGDLLALGRPSAPRPWLGVNLQDIGGRLVVSRVSRDGPADKAGVQDGDRVTAIGGARVSDLADFYRALWGRGNAGIAVDLTVTRGGETREIAVETIDRYRYLKLDTAY